MIGMRIAVTGSTGLIGKTLVKELKARRFDVVECNHTNCNVLKPEQLKKAFKGANVVVHCAAKLDEEAKDLFEVNVKGTENVLDVCAENQVGQVVFLSSVGVFGSAKGLKDEKTKPQPETRYEKSKFEAEQKVLSYQELFNITILRPAIVLGNNKYWQKIIKLVKKGFPLVGSGENKWQIVCAENVVSAIIFSINNEKCFGETFIVADKDVMSLRELVEFIREKSGMEKKAMSVPVWLGSLMAFVNQFIKVVPLLTPAYLKRLSRERFYSTKKLESLGWKQSRASRDCLAEIIQKN